MSDEFVPVQRLADPDFRPNRRTAQTVYADIVQTHINAVNPDAQVVDQEMIEIMHDAILFSRSFFHFTKSIDEADAFGDKSRSLIARAQAMHAEHTIICQALNKITPELHMRTVGGSLSYHWSATDEDGVPARVSINIGSQALIPEEGMCPVVWSESGAVHWNFAAEFESQKEQREESEEYIEDSGVRYYSYGVSGYNDEYDRQPIIIDTTLAAVAKQSKIPASLRKPIQSASEATIHPLYRGISGPVMTNPNATFSLYIADQWNDLAMKMAEDFIKLRFQAYKIWRGE